MAGVDAREPTPASRRLGKIRSVVRPFGTGGLSSRRSERRSPRPRRGAFRARYDSGSDCAACLWFHEVAGLELFNGIMVDGSIVVMPFDFSTKSAHTAVGSAKTSSAEG